MPTKSPAKTRIRPLDDRIVVMSDKAEEITAGGLYIPDSAKEEKTQMGTVLAIGNLIENIKVGERVMFGKYGGTDITVDNTSYLMLKQEEVLCVIEDK